MKKSLIFSASLAMVLLPMPVALVYAQTTTGGVDAPMANTRAAKRARDAKKNAASNVAQTWPNASREAPKQSGTPALAKQLTALFALQEKNDSDDQMVAAAAALLADPRANAFDKSSAAYLAAGAWQAKETTDYANAIKYYKQAIDSNGLHNNLHFQSMLQVAQLLDADDKHDEALAFIDRFLTETKSEDPKALAIKSRILLRADKPEQALVFLEKQLAAKPKDKQLMFNLASLYQQAGQDAKAGQMFDRMRAAGLLTESKDYEMAYHLLANIDGRESEALAIINEGLEKGILTPGYDVYAFQGQAYYAAEQIPKAIESWSKGAPLSKNGEMYLNLGKLQADQEHWAQARAAGKSALEKGVKKTGEAWQVIARSEAALGNKAGATAAYRESAKYPETKKWAEAALKQAPGK